MLDGHPIYPVIFAGDDIPEPDLEPFDKLQSVLVVRDSHFRRSGLVRRQISVLARGRDKYAEKLYSAHDINGVFENAFFHGARTKLPVLVWIPDFQHKQLPQLFSTRRYWKRDIGFRMQLAYRRNVLLSSADAEKDLRNFYPQYSGKTHILRFCAALPSSILDLDFSALQAEYELPDKFIYLPNQFYFHKNHSVVIETLKVLRDAGENITVVASGSITGSPSSNSIDSIRRLIRKYEVGSNFRILGSIPYMHVLGLMLMSSATLNPSLFEGWSTTVEEAKALDVPLILSDIGVHLEQAHDQAQFFDPGNPIGLAERMKFAIDRNCGDDANHGLSELLQRNQKNRIRGSTAVFNDPRTEFLL